ncbi:MULTISPECIES: HAMP domain-containing sensor histidine kinase [Vagococcus]|uniref:histidine kinase n=1 Tax=Vagococcus fluvialis bH819 TaxID=1255619 RepID=A0A1X6WLL8_9ENTE|nr:MULTISPECIES: HAMP domain-containing sensor histidine kinase [Vagococcus]SLM85132.1 hypothetical protein FM121_03475 [Vagococcus fluvialis bH819]HCM88453.1 sensor histidine kinase [Vagococcus sp.]
MKRSIKTQLIVSFLAITTLIIGSLSMITLSLMNNHFNQYVKEKQNDLLNQYTDSITFLFDSSQNKWDETALSDLSQKADKDYLYFSISSPDNSIIWKQEENKLTETKAKLKKHAKIVSNTKSANLNKEISVTKELKRNTNSLGFVTFYYYGPFAYTEHDAMFIASMKKSLVIVALVALLISILFASWVAEKLSLPLTHVSKFTHQLTLGKYAEKLPQETTINEINSLIDSLNALSRQLDKQDSLRKRLTSDISHELRTPLATLKGNLEAMIDGVWKVDSDRLQLCYDEVDRLTRLINDLELLNQVKENTANLTITAFDLYELSQSVIANFSSQIAAKNLILTLTGEPINFHGDKDRLQQVLTNILNNAIKFTQRNGKITLQLTHDTHLIYLNIKDNGIGIDTEHLPFIFNRFYMTDPSRNRSLGGQGIGLSIVKSIIDSHHGTISVESELGLGTTFKIELPMR